MTPRSLCAALRVVLLAGLSARPVPRNIFYLCILVVALGGCADSDLPSFDQAPTTITGTVTAPAADSSQFVAARPGGVLSMLASFVFGSVHAEITGLAPVAGATVELVRLSDGTVVDTATTDGNGVYLLPDVPAIGPAIQYMVLVRGQDDIMMRAIVTGAVVDISPASEVVAEAVLDGPFGGALGNFMVQEVAALNGLLASLDVDVTGMDFATAVQAIRDAAGTIFQDMVDAFSTPGAVAVLRAGDYSVVDYAGALRDPLIVPRPNAPGGTEIGSGQGVMIFGGARDTPLFGFVSIGKFLHDFAAVLDPSELEDPGEVEDPGEFEDPGEVGEDVAFPYVVLLTDLLHVPNDERQVAIADGRNPSASVAGVGATTENGTYLVYPLDSSVRVDDALSISGMGIRYAARWRLAGTTQPPLLDLTLFDEEGGAGTVYNQVRLQQVLSGVDSGANTVTWTTAVGTTTFDSTPQVHDFDVPRDFGSFVSEYTVTDSLRLDLADYAISADNGSDLLDGLYSIPQNSGIVQFREATAGALLGFGATSTDGERDGEILGAQMFSGGFDSMTTAERSFSIAIRRAEGMLAGDLSGTYNVVGYAGYFSNDPTADPPRAFVETGVRHGTVELNGAGGVSPGTALFRKLARLDVAAALGETGAEPNASGESGTFMTATAGEPGEEFTLEVGDITVYTFTSNEIGDTVEAADIQGGVDASSGALDAVGITASGTVGGGNLVFTKADATPFTILVTNTFSGLDGAAGGFAGAQFQTGTNTVTDGTEAQAAVPNASGASGGFSPATSGDADETFSMVVGEVPVFSFTSTAADETVQDTDVQNQINDAESALNAAGIEVSGTVAGGDLVFTRADRTPFDIVVTNTFTGTPGGFAGADFQPGTNTIDNGEEPVPADPTVSAPSGAFTTAVATESSQTYSMMVAGVPVFSFTSAAAGDTVTAVAIQAEVDAAAGALNEAGITPAGDAADGDLVFTKADGEDFDIVIVNQFTGGSASAGGFAGDDFAIGSRTINNGALAGAAPSVSSQSGQQGVSSGSYIVSGNGEVTLFLTVGDETISGQGAVTQDGDFIALVTSSDSDDDTRRGRGILFLVRQPE